MWTRRCGETNFSFCCFAGSGCFSQKAIAKSSLSLLPVISGLHNFTLKYYRFIIMAAILVRNLRIDNTRAPMDSPLAVTLDYTVTENISSHFWQLEVFFLLLLEPLSPQISLVFCSLLWILHTQGKAYVRISIIFLWYNLRFCNQFLPDLMRKICSLARHIPFIQGYDFNQFLAYMLMLIQFAGAILQFLFFHSSSVTLPEFFLFLFLFTKKLIVHKTILINLSRPRASTVRTLYRTYSRMWVCSRCG